MRIYVMKYDHRFQVSREGISGIYNEGRSSTSQIYVVIGAEIIRIEKALWKVVPLKMYSLTRSSPKPSPRG